MELLGVFLWIATYLVSGGAAIELLAALFSKRVRRYIAQHPVAHALWFACALMLGLTLIPDYSTRHGGF